MATNRRDFLRNTLIGAGVLSTGLVLPATAGPATTVSGAPRKKVQRFNMSEIGRAHV